MARKIDLSEWYTAKEATQKLSENAGRPISVHYPRTLVRYGKVNSLDLGARGKLYWKRDIDSYVVATKRGQKAAQEREELAN